MILSPWRFFLEYRATRRCHGEQHIQPDRSGPTIRIGTHRNTSWLTWAIVLQHLLARAQYKNVLLRLRLITANLYTSQWRFVAVRLLQKVTYPLNVPVANNDKSLPRSSRTSYFSFGLLSGRCYYFIRKMLKRKKRMELQWATSSGTFTREKIARNKISLRIWGRARDWTAW